MPDNDPVFPGEILAVEINTVAEVLATKKSDAIILHQSGAEAFAEVFLALNS